MFFTQHKEESKEDIGWVHRMQKLKKFIQQHPYTLTYEVYSKNPTSFFAEEEFLRQKAKHQQ